MASVTLKHVWIHNAADLSDFVVLPWSEMSVEPARKAEVRTRAGGRQVIVSSPARWRTATITFPLVDRTSLATLEDWCGTRVFVRDSRGRTMFGMFPVVNITERRNNHEPVVGLTLREVSGTVEV